MKNKRFSQLDSETKKVIFNSLNFYNQLKYRKIFVSKRLDFSVETEYVLADDVDVRTISLFLGVLSFENKVSNYFMNKGVTTNSVLNYISIAYINTKVHTLDDIYPDSNLTNFLEKLKNKDGNLEIVKLTSSLFSKFISDSDIMFNFYYSSFSKNVDEFYTIKKQIKGLNNKSYFDKLFDVTETINIDFLTE